MEYSFIIPVYNCGRYLTDCVESIRAVAVGEYEILLIDDGSTDGTGSLCDKLAERFSEIHVVHQNNTGVSEARNRGICESFGEKIMFFDADDRVEPDALRKILMDSRCQQVDLVIFGLTFDYYRGGKCYRRDSLYYPFDGILNRQSWGCAFHELFIHNSWSPVWNKVFRRDILMNNNLWMNTDMFLYEDFEFVLRYLQHCDRIWNVPQAVYHYRQSEDEGNAKRRLSRIDSLPEFLQPIETSLEKLRQHNSAISREAIDTILKQLYLALAREKISVSNLDGIHRICRDFACWAEKRGISVEDSGFQKQLQQDQAAVLYLTDKKTALRHWIAVRVKFYIYRIRGEKRGFKR